MKRQYITSYIGLPVARAVMGLVFTEFIYKIDKQLANHKRKRKRKNANQLRLIQYFNKNINKNKLKKIHTNTHSLLLSIFLKDPPLPISISSFPALSRIQGALYLSASLLLIFAPSPPFSWPLLPFPPFLMSLKPEVNSQTRARSVVQRRCWRFTQGRSSGNLNYRPLFPSYQPPITTAGPSTPSANPRKKETKSWNSDQSSRDI